MALKGRTQDTGYSQDGDGNLQDGGLEVVFVDWGQVADEGAEGEFGEAQACDVEDVCGVLRLDLFSWNRSRLTIKSSNMSAYFHDLVEVMARDCGEMIAISVLDCYRDGRGLSNAEDQRYNDEIVIAGKSVEDPQLRSQPYEDAQTGHDNEEPVCDIHGRVPGVNIGKSPHGCCQSCRSGAGQGRARARAAAQYKRTGTL